MKFLDHAFHARRGDVIEVTLDRKANVRLLDEPNFHRYRNGQQPAATGAGEAVPGRPPGATRRTLARGGRPGRLPGPGPDLRSGASC